MFITPAFAQGSLFGGAGGEGGMRYRCSLSL